MIDEASRERFIYPYKEQSGYSSVDFVKRAIAYFGYAPETIQTDNGAEFCNTQKTKRVHYFDAFLNHLGITHKTIRPRTPWHNGKVERLLGITARLREATETTKNVSTTI